jgi:hypothetical protein
VKIKTLYTYCEEVGRRGKAYEKKPNSRDLSDNTNISGTFRFTVHATNDLLNKYDI